MVNRVNAASGLVIFVVVSCLPTVATFCPAGPWPQRASVVPLAISKPRWRCSAKGEQEMPDFSSPKRSVLLVTGVLGPDVDKLKRILMESGAPEVAIEEAQYGSKLVASLGVEKLQRLAPKIADAVRPSGRIGISGIANADCPKVQQAFASFFEDVKQIDEGDGYARVTAWRKDPWMVIANMCILLSPSILV